MKTTRNDPFDLNLCIRGLGNQLTYMHTDIYIFMYSMTFRMKGKANDNEFDDAFKNFENNMEIFTNSTDPFVKSCSYISQTIMNYKAELCSKWNIDERADMQDDMIREEAVRYNERFLSEIKRKNFLKLGITYGKILEGFLECLNAYLCATTIGSYKIPMVLEKQLDLCDQHRLDLPLENEKIFRFMNELINGTMDHFLDYQREVDRTMGTMKLMGIIKL